MEKRYNLNGFIIVERENYLGWIQHVGDFYGTGGMMYLEGRAYVQHVYDVTLLGRPTSMSEDTVLKSFDDVERHLDVLPVWDRTKYYVKIADLGLYSLIECETGDSVYSEINPAILKSLVSEKDQEEVQQ
jgi:hypothetical protein